MARRLQRGVRVRPSPRGDDRGGGPGKRLPHIAEPARITPSHAVALATFTRHPPGPSARSRPPRSAARTTAASARVVRGIVLVDLCVYAAGAQPVGERQSALLMLNRIVTVADEHGRGVPPPSAVSSDHRLCDPVHQDPGRSGAPGGRSGDGRRTLAVGAWTVSAGGITPTATTSAS
jgi:hypothetical protein